MFVRGKADPVYMYLLFTHFDFVIHYNGNKIIEIR
jgi:hypothetical protein